MDKVIKIAGPVSRFFPASAHLGKSSLCGQSFVLRLRAVGIPSTTATRVDWNLGIGNWSLMNGGVN